jgi:hypothetical protein
MTEAPAITGATFFTGEETEHGYVDERDTYRGCNGQWQ